MLEPEAVGTRFPLDRQPEDPGWSWNAHQALSARHALRSCLPSPIHLDGSRGEGGGQILRTAVALSTLLGRPFEIDRIRAGRKTPGLRPQHAGILRFLADVTGGHVEGASVGSSGVRFTPGVAGSGRFDHDIGTAGSMTLFLQAVLPVFLLTPGTTELRLRGGTDVAFAPTIDWYTWIHVPYVAALVDRLEVEVVRRGLYPKGGGELVVRIENRNGPPAGDVDAVRRHVDARLGQPRTTWGQARRATISSFAATELQEAEVAERQAVAAAAVLRRHLLLAPDKRSAYEATRSMGSSIAVMIEDELGHRIGGDALGARGVRAEAVGHQAAGEAWEDLQTGATVDRHMADQVVPWVALGAGPVRVPSRTGHLETNVETCRAFLGADAVGVNDGILTGNRR